MKLGGGKEWFTAAELAELDLPGLRKTKRKVNELADERGWKFLTNDAGEPLARPRQARGGGTEYHIDVLPAATRSALVARGVGAVAHVASKPETRAASMWGWFEAQNEKTQGEARKRAQIVALVETYERVGLTRSAAVASTAARSAVAASTLWGWLALLDGVSPADRLPYLAPRRAGGAAAADIDARAWQLFLSDYLRPEKPTLSECFRRTQAWAAANGIELPHQRTFNRRLDKLDQRIVVAKRAGAEALRRMLPSQQRSVAELHAMEAVNIDGHKFDVFCRYPDGRIARPLMIAIQDVYSRKMLAWRVAESENAIDTRLAFAELFKTWGIPRHCLLDNGRAFASKWITGGAPNRFRFKVKDDEPLGLLTALGIVIHWATPFRGQSKPIERAFKDLTDIIARHPATHGAYTGHKPDAKPENYGDAAVPIEDFKRLVEVGIAAHNARVGRRTETARGRFSFDQVFAESYAAAPIGKATPEQLRIALLAAEQQTCDRSTAEIRLEGNRYWSPALHAHAGKRVTVRFNPDNLHEEVHVYANNGEFIATAEIIDKTGFFDKESAGKRRKQEADWRRQVRDATKLEDLLSIGAVASMLSDEPEPLDMPEATVVRPVRMRGQTAAALKPVSEVAPHQPAPEVVDRMTSAMERLRIVR
ncbi:MAG: hypothetical protein EOP62_14235 [Sphingomonadales bacterium]|nr:MAG: hypothetical protein EOP62_14235 [Sphingomonadales bacterium]